MGDREGATAVAPRVAMSGGVDQTMAEVLGELLDSKAVDHHDHFFEVLGANSMTMAHFCAKLRKRPEFPPISMKLVYAHPTIATLAAAVQPAPDLATGAPAVVASEPEPPPLRASTAAYLVCGAAQAAIFLVYSYLLFLVGVPAYGWIAGGVGVVEIYLRAVLVGGGLFLGVCLLPVAVKWILIGRWTQREIALWSTGYLRFWIVKALVHANPIVLFTGNPIYPLYLRALGARIGPGVVILTRSAPVCTDLLTIGAGAVVRKDSFLLGYRAHAGRIQTGPVTIGAGALVGEKAILDIDTVVGAGSQLGHTSSLQPGERIPDGEHWHGSPAERTDVDYLRVATLDESRGDQGRRARLRRVAYVTGSLLQLFLVVLPLVFGGSYLLVAMVPQVGVLVAPTMDASASVVLRALWLAAALFVALGVVMVVLVFVVPRLLGRLVRPDTAYPLYGVHYSMHRTVTALTNRKLLNWLFGDSSYITGYLSRLGYGLGVVEQTGSNFGTDTKHETPYHVSVGPGTMVADGLSVINADYSSSSFRVSEARIAGQSFLGNKIGFPSGARIGENCLLATKVMVPLDGPLREGVGLLGSPPFEIPRTVDRDESFDHLRSGDVFESALRAKNRYNLRSMVLLTALRFVHLFLLTLLALVLLDLGVTGKLGQVLIAAYAPATLVLTVAFWVVVERTVCRFGSLEPKLVSIYDPYFWWHERMWKVPENYVQPLNGTPFKPFVWRLLGVRTGARVFDDGASITERTLTSLGDDCVLNHGVTVQCHSQEDGTFKSDRTSVGAGATLGVATHVHYGVSIGDGATVIADSFVMKGEDVPDRARWGGNPAAPTTQGVGR